jgi:hypothetical protein
MKMMRARSMLKATHRVHVAKITERDLRLDPRFQLDFNTAFVTGPAASAWPRH